MAGPSHPLRPDYSNYTGHRKLSDLEMKALSVAELCGERFTPPPDAVTADKFFFFIGTTTSSLHERFNILNNSSPCPECSG
jgi:hypothetical protein